MRHVFVQLHTVRLKKNDYFFLYFTLTYLEKIKHSNIGGVYPIWRNGAKFP